MTDKEQMIVMFVDGYTRGTWKYLRFSDLFKIYVMESISYWQTEVIDNL
jgi:hypothetical protein